MRLILEAASIALACAIPACFGQVDSSSSSKAPETPTAGGVQPAASPALTAANARCNDARGVGDPVKVKTDLPPRFAGKWFLCPGFGKKEQEPLADKDALEISEDGHWWTLVLGPDDVWTRKPGIENAGTWDQDWTDANQPSLAYMREWNNAFYWLDLGFETAPRRALGTYYSSNPVHMVPID